MFPLISLIYVVSQLPRALFQVTSVPDHLQEHTPNPLYRPELIIFDTDHLLWPFWVDIKVTPPFKKTEDGTVTDQLGFKLKTYPDVPMILKKLKEANYTLAVASRAEYGEETKDLLRYFDLRPFFKYVVIRPGTKRFHFEELKEKSGVPFENMLFFDAEARNVIATRKVGIPSILVKNGLDLVALDRGLGRYRKLKQEVQAENKDVKEPDY